MHTCILIINKISAEFYRLIIPVQSDLSVCKTEIYLNIQSIDTKCFNLTIIGYENLMCFYIIFNYLI